MKQQVGTMSFWQLGILKNVMLTKFYRMTGRQNSKLAKWQIDKMTSWQNDMQYLVHKIASLHIRNRPNVKLTKWNEMPRWQDRKLT